MLEKALNNLYLGKLLDIGTGRGELISTLLQEQYPFSEIIGIDTSDKTLNLCKEEFKNYEHVNFMLMSAEEMLFDNESFDTICISNTLHHLPPVSLTKVFKEIFRVLKPNGKLLICEMCCDNQDPKRESHVLLHHLSAKMDREAGKYHRDTYTKEELHELVKDLLENNYQIEENYIYSEEPLDDMPLEELISIEKSFLERNASLSLEIEKVFNHIKTHNINSADEIIILASKL